MIDFTEEQFKEYQNHSISFRNLTKECLPVINKTGQDICEIFKDTETPRYIVFCHDILKRVRDNLQFLAIQDPPQDYNAVPLQLILRGVFNDLIALTYVVANFDNKHLIDALLSNLDLDAVNGKLSLAECEKEFMILCGKPEWTSYFDEKYEDLKDTEKEILSPHTSKKQFHTEFNKKTTKELADYFKTRDDLKPFYPLLYGSFRMLSQVEHYANENRSFSYNKISTAFFFNKCAVSYKLVLECLCKNIESHLHDEFGKAGSAVGLS